MSIRPAKPRHHMFDVQGFILVGGLSRRMGRDKAQLVFGGKSLLERIAGALGAAACSVTLVGGHPGFSGPSLPNVSDVHQAWGALGGIHAALVAANTEWIIVVACDLPFVTRELFQRLKSFLEEAVDAVVPIQPDGRPQPICALYRRDKCLAEAGTLIDSGEHTPRALLANVRTRYIQVSELSDLPGAENFFLNLNTPEDLARAQRLVEN